MPLLSSIALKLKVPVILQVMLLVVVVFCYLSSEHEIHSKRQQTKEMGAIVGRLQSMTTDMQLFLRQGEFGKIDAELREQTLQLDRLSVGKRLAPPLKRIGSVLQGASQFFTRNQAIEKEVFQLTDSSIEISDRFIAHMSAKLADPGQERTVSRMERAVIAGASVNSGTNHRVQELFLRMKGDDSRRKELISFLDTAISNTTTDVQRLAGTLFAGLAQKNLDANRRIRELVLEYQANCDRLAVSGREIGGQSTLLRGELDRFAENSMLAAYDFFQVRMLTLLLVITVAVAVLAVLNWSLSRSILRPIAAITEVLRNISRGEGDLTLRLPVASADEIGEVCRLFNVFIEKLQGIIGQVARTAGEVAAASAHLFDSSGKLAQATEEMADKANTLATASEEMSATINGIARNCNLAADNSRQATSAAASGSQVVESTIAGMERIAANTKLSAGTVSALGNRSEQIGAIVATIEDIADQTNLLALNAAIEAARAGDQGRGFAVVADEVRALAERTTNATKEIGDMIRSIQGETRKAVAVMEEGVVEVARGSAEASKSREALREIMERIDEVALQVSQVATAAEQQSSTTAQINSNIVQMTRVVHGSSDNARMSAEATFQLSASATCLQQLMAQFRL